MAHLYFLVAVAVLTSIWLFLNRPKLPPGTKWLPGPRGVPLLGRFWGIPRNHMYLHFKQWSDIYGPIFAVQVFGITHIWLASDKVATDLLSRRGDKHQHRPAIGQLENSRNRAEYIPLLGYNAVHRRQRKIGAQILMQSTKDGYRNIPYLELGQFLCEFLDNPENYQQIIENYTSRVMSRLAYGVPDFYNQVAYCSHELIRAISSAVFLTNIIPQLRWIPAFMSPWKWAEEKRHSSERKLFTQMVDSIAEKMKTGQAKPSYLRQVLENKEKFGVGNLESSYIVGMISSAAVVTISSVLMNYTLAMTLYPECQKKLQEEVDEVCGGRMPRYEDSPRMPILRAVVKEVLRWRPVDPAGIPREATEDDVFEAYHIPKGAFIHPNQWAMAMNPEIYPEPKVFNLDRWLNPAYPSYKEPLTKYPTIQHFSIFGYGRRVCLGMDLLENQLFVAMGAMAWSSTMTKKKDLDGREIHVPSHDYTPYFISQPKKFAFDVRPRTDGRKVELQQIYANSLKEMDPPEHAQKKCV